MAKKKRENVIIQLEALAILYNLNKLESISKYEIKIRLKLSNYKHLDKIMEPLIEKKMVGTEMKPQPGKPDEPKTMYFMLEKGLTFYKNHGIPFLRQFTDFDF